MLSQNEKHSLIQTKIINIYTFSGLQLVTGNRSTSRLPQSYFLPLVLSHYKHPRYLGREFNHRHCLCHNFLSTMLLFAEQNCSDRQKPYPLSPGILRTYIAYTSKHLRKHFPLFFPTKVKLCTSGRFKHTGNRLQTKRRYKIH